MAIKGLKPLAQTQRLRAEQELVEIAARLSAAAHYAERIAECFAMREVGEHVAHSHRVSLVDNLDDIKEALSAVTLLQELRPLNSETKHN